jgi:hypothetical protein
MLHGLRCGATTHGVGDQPMAKFPYVWHACGFDAFAEVVQRDAGVHVGYYFVLQKYIVKFLVNGLESA